MKKKTLYFSSPGRIEIHEEDIPTPNAGEVLVQTLCSAISSGMELLIYRNQALSDVPSNAVVSNPLEPLQYPVKFKSSAVGTVQSVGDGVHPELIGSTVFAFHAHESHFVCPHTDIVPLPPELEPEDGVFLADLEGAVNLLMDGKPIIGERVAVFGQGIMGLLTTRLLANLPLELLLTLDPYLKRRDASLQMGATASLDPLNPGFIEDLWPLFTEDGKFPEADLTYELSGEPAVLDAAIAATAFGGRIVIGSWYGRKQAPLDLGGHFHRNRIQLISSHVDTLAPEFSARWSLMRRQQIALNQLAPVAPSQLISHRYNIADASDAYALLDEDSEQALQVILTY